MVGSLVENEEERLYTRPDPIPACVSQSVSQSGRQASVVNLTDMLLLLLLLLLLLSVCLSDSALSLICTLAKEFLKRNHPDPTTLTQLLDLDLDLGKGSVVKKSDFSIFCYTGIYIYIHTSFHPP